MQSWRQLSESDRRRRWWWAVGGVVLFVVLGLVLIPGLARYERDAAPTASTAWPDRAAQSLETGTDPSRSERALGFDPEPPEVSPELPSFDCMIAPNKVVEIGSAITGLIEAIPVERSDHVEAGQVIAQLESSVEQAAIRVARARAEREVELETGQVKLELSEKRRARAFDLFERESVSLDTRDELETEAELAALELERARQDRHLASLQLEQVSAALERRTIRSPVSGFVVERLMDPGEVVDEETILRIAEVDPLRVEVILPSRAFGHVRPGDRAEIIPEPPLDAVRTAEVLIVDPVIDGASGTFGARLLLPNPDHALPAGLRCQVRFVEAPRLATHDLDETG